ncbi:hypothetical protein [Acetivibrio ethanolgignens]|uniref:Chorion class high-cysteine HCB protein 13 n=1 Tax=Acetivibrio ethanolgignens TaxID=290052 RepID=A0A0V8QCT8_9FIRM|nr:hypothetical protein [Acetivibrio ethanolgignens]KSV58298.1 hypothetical protein ASU35_13170 [Acetivibrio ethanolgignens]
MSDLAATNCGTSCGCNGGNNCLWILLLLFFCGNGRGIFGGNGCGCDGLFGGDNDDCCSWIIILILIFCCGGCRC